MRKVVIIVIAFLCLVNMTIISHADNTHSFLSVTARDKLMNDQLDHYKKMQSKLWDDSIDGRKYLNSDSMELAILLASKGNATAELWARETLNFNAKLLDPVWGGVYNYSSQNDWDHPDYNKTMLVQANEMSIYALGYVYWGNPAYLLVAEKTAEYVKKFLTSPDGAFYTGQSAYLISDKQDPAYYELNELERNKIGIPPVDKAIYANINAAGISGFTYLYMMSGDTEYLHAALKASDWAIKNLGLPDGGFKHNTQKTDGIYLSDTLQMAKAFLLLYKATIDQQYLQRAEQAMSYINKYFVKKDNKPGFISFVPADNTANLPSTFDISENELIAHMSNLLYHYSGNKTYADMEERAEQYLVSPDTISLARIAGLLLIDMQLHEKNIKITIIGSKKDPAATALYKAALRYPAMNTKIDWLDKNEKPLPDTYPPLKQAAAFVCAPNHCSLPIYDSKKLEKVSRDLMYNVESSEKKTSEQNTKKLESMNKLSGMQLKVADVLASQNWIYILGGFWLFGLLLSLTPCVFPLVLVLTSLLMSQGLSVTRGRILGLSISYITAMALTYAVAGIISATLGIYVQMYFQKSWIIISISVFLVLLAFSLLGFYKITLPPFAKQFLISFNTIRASNTYIGAAGMGIVATLIASPCTTAPLIGVLTFIAEKGNIVLGGFALFFMGLGVGTPLVFMSVVGGNILPRMQNWQRGLQAFFGLILVAVSIWLVSRVVSPIWVMMMWSGLVIITAIYMGALKNTSDEGAWKFWRAMSIMVLIYGVALFIGALIGNKNPLNPLAQQLQSEAEKTLKVIVFQTIKTNDELQTALNAAATAHKPVLLDFYADWCTSCKEMDKDIFNNPEVIELLNQYTLLRVDLTDVNSTMINIAKDKNVTAPPTIIFFDKNGKELSLRVYGDTTVENFISLLKQILTNE